MRLAILGGSFNPVHIGHLILAESVLAQLRYDRIILVPANRSPFKLSAPGMEDNARDRLAMLCASIAGDPRLTVDDCEIRRKGVSYTVDTVADIIRRYAPEGKPGLIIGDDLAADFSNWHKSGEITAMADIIIARRENDDVPKLPWPHFFIDNDIIEVSSAAIRERIAANTVWRYLVPAAARTIIEDRQLYGFTPQPAPPAGEGSPAESPAKGLIRRVEAAVREAVSIERFLHSRNVALMSRDLCCRFSLTHGLDPELGYLAGIAHDLGKPLDAKELFRLVKNDGRRLSRLEKEKPTMLLHGRAAAVLLRERFNVHNSAVLEAVSLHTAGGKDMGPLAKVVYIADKMEVSREKADPVLRRLVYTGNDLDKIFFAVLDQTVSRLRAKEYKLSGETLSLLEKMRSLSG